MGELVQISMQGNFKNVQKIGIKFILVQNLCNWQRGAFLLKVDEKHVLRKELFMDFSIVFVPK